MTAAEVIEKMKSGWILVANRETKTQANGDIECLDISELMLSMDGETDVKLPINIFEELRPHLAEPDRDHGCMFTYSLV